MISIFVLFAIFAVLFFVVSLTTNIRWKWLVVIINLIFVGVTYFSISSLLGRSKPLEYQVPGFNHIVNKAEIRYAWWDQERIYLILTDDSDTLYWSMPYDQKFIDELMRALQKTKGKYKDIYYVKKKPTGNGKKGRKDDNDAGLMHYHGDTGAHVMMPDPQKNLYVPKNESTPESGFEEKFNIE